MKPLIDLSLYLVTHRMDLEKENFFEIILAAVKGGITAVQLREKTMPACEMIALGKELHSLLQPLGIPLIINDRPDVALAIGAAGVHLGQSDVNAAEARSLLGRDAIIGLSVESLEQAKNAIKEDIDYLAASPLFPSKTKTDCAPAWELDDLKQLCALSPYPVIAIGGIDLTNVKKVVACGPAGIAIVSAIFNSPSPQTAAQLFKEAIHEQQKNS